MNPVSPVMPGSAPIETILAKNQPQYGQLPAVRLEHPAGPYFTRWRPTDEERAKLAAGADVVMCQCTFGHPYHPTHMQVCFINEQPDLLTEE